ncbi:GNAT family N-acetyltransferase [Marinilactibacillus piezotolerans]|uniref:GNAT family N-acetyltransferase n=1 Tax=Marinilactibacillus piezotolerans TaxID=258723 RepID=UPI0009B06A9E|nr:GNAT family N-acetyltransferase [Marinilactibacillus piezotolerans]
MLETERLKLRDYTEDDFEFLYSLTSNEKIMKYIGNGQTRDRIETKEFMDKMLKMYDESIHLGLRVIELKSTGEAIGHAGFIDWIIEDNEYTEIGYWIAEDYWNQGYATEIAIALRTFGEQMLQLEEMISLVQVGNTGSENVAEKNGMQVLKQVAMKGKSVNVYSTKA